MACRGRVLLRGAPTVTMSCLYILISVAVMICAQGSSAQIYYGKRISKMSELEHGVKGDIYVVDSRTIHIKGFSYDGTAPDAFFYAGKSGRSPSDKGLIIPDENGSKEPLGAYSNKDVTLTLPDGMTIKDIAWISIWCRKFAINFGHVMVPRGFDYPRPQKIDAIPTFEHGVSSDRIVVVDAQTFLIPNFYYDGTAPDAFFWVGKGTKPDPSGTKVPDENGSLEPLKKYSGKTIVITLPGDMTVFDVDYLGVWCKAFFANFGHVLLPKNLNVPPSLKMLGVAPQRSPGYSYPSPSPSTAFRERGNPSRPQSPFRHPPPSTSQKTRFPSTPIKNEVFSNRFDQRTPSSFTQNPFQSKPSSVSFPDEALAKRHRFSAFNSAKPGSLRQPSANRKIDSPVFGTNPSQFNPAASHFSSRIQQSNSPINRPSNQVSKPSVFRSSRRPSIPFSSQSRRQQVLSPSETFRQPLRDHLPRPDHVSSLPRTHGVNNFRSSGNSRPSNFQQKNRVIFETREPSNRFIEPSNRFSEPSNRFSDRSQRGRFGRAKSNGLNKSTRHFRPERIFDLDLQPLRGPISTTFGQAESKVRFLDGGQPTRQFRPERILVSESLQPSRGPSTTFGKDDSKVRFLDDGQPTRHFRPERNFDSESPQPLSGSNTFDGQAESKVRFLEDGKPTRHFRREQTFNSDNERSGGPKTADQQPESNLQFFDNGKPKRQFRQEGTFSSELLPFEPRTTVRQQPEPNVQFFDNGKPTQQLRPEEAFNSQHQPLSGPKTTVRQPESDVQLFDNGRPTRQFRPERVLYSESLQPLSGPNTLDGQAESTTRFLDDGQPSRQFRPEEAFDSDIQPFEPRTTVKQPEPDVQFFDNGKPARQFRPDEAFNSQHQSLSGPKTTIRQPESNVQLFDNGKPTRQFRVFRSERILDSENLQPLGGPSTFVGQREPDVLVFDNGKPTRQLRLEEAFDTDIEPLNGHSTNGQPEPKIRYFDNGRGSKFLIMRLEKIPQRQELSSTDSFLFQTRPQTLTQSKQRADFQRTFGRGTTSSRSDVQRHPSLYT